MQLEKIQNHAPKVPELVMKALLSAMEDGQIKVGEELPSERDLAETLGIGRGSLRECLAILEYLSIIETRGNRKVVIKDAAYFRKAVSFVRLSIQEDTLLDSIEFRRVNEVAIVELACERATEEDLERLNESVLRLEKDLYDYMADVDFHCNLARASHNVIFAATIDLFTTMIADVRLRYYKLPNYYKRTLDSHRRIYKAIENRDRISAREEMEKHLNLILDFMKESSEQPPQEDDDPAT
jgi:GntR family transcriptional repressor for pyruvate dehydrogenase complex